MKSKIFAEKGDITKYKVDAIVNAANTRLIEGAGVCGAIFRAAGPDLAKEIALLKRNLQRDTFDYGACTVTKGHNLPAKNIIHAIGPDTRDEAIKAAHNEVFLLTKCYLGVMQAAEADGFSSLAIPAISTGIYGFPLRDATAIATSVVRAFVQASTKNFNVTLVCFDDKTLNVYREMLEQR